jgi:hypothetical protein
MTKLLALLTVLYFIFLGASAHAGVWVNQHGWLDQAPRPENKTSLASYTYEDAYSDWVDTKLGVNFLAAETIPLKVLDCKQAVYLIRLGYAFHLKLPFVFTNRNGVLVSNDSTIPEVEKLPLNSTDPNNVYPRLFAFMSYVRDNATADHLGEDTYSIQVNTDNLRPGAILLMLAGPGINHSLTIWHAIKGIGFLDFIGGTDEPDVRSDIATRALYETIMMRPTATFWKPPRNGKPGLDGFRAWRHREIPIESEVGYDKKGEQYTDAFRTYTDSLSDSPTMHSWSDAVFFHLVSNLQPMDQINLIFKPLVYNVLENRKKYLNDYERDERPLVGHRCLTSAEYDKYTTGNARDPDIIGVFRGIDDFLARQKRNQYHDYFVKVMDEYLNSMAVTYDADTQGAIFYSDFKFKLLAGQVSSNPNDSLARKWGVINDGDLESTCPQY